MSRVCESTGRRTRGGNKVSRRGLAKKKGGGLFSRGGSLTLSNVTFENNRPDDLDAK